MSRLHLDKVEKIAGFTIQDVHPGEIAPILVRASLISDQPEFHLFTEQIANLFLSSHGILTRTSP